MPKSLTTFVGKSVRTAMRLRGGGSALPGLIVEKIDPDYIKSTLSTLPHGVVVISGTNGKTTTTKMVVELLESQGLKVFTNKTGSNFTRGVAAALLGEVNKNGVLDADIAVLELDEAHAVHFVRSIPPKYSLILNVMRDQLDRFGEIDTTASLLQTITEATTDAVILNREDRRIASLADHLRTQKVHFFGLSDELLETFPHDDSLRGKTERLNSLKADVVLESFQGDTAVFTVAGKRTETSLKLNGVYNIFNAAAALALVRAIVTDVDETKLLKALSNVLPAFGRGETLIVHGQPIELVLIKNPSGFRLGLQSFDPTGFQTMIAINDNYADGRDMSWLWDVDFSSLRDQSVAVTTGIRAYDMTLRLQYDDVIVGAIEPNLMKALKRFIATYPDTPKRIYCTYTAMLALRREIGKLVHVESIG